MNQPNVLTASGSPQTGRRNRTAAGRVTWAPALVVGAVAASILFLALARWPDTPDGWLHLQRTRALSEALQAGVFYPRWFPDFSFGYGYPVFNFYAPAFYYLPALLVWLGAGVVDAVRISLAVGYGISAAAMYCLLRTRSSSIPALAGTVLFLLFPYRLYDLFVRGALPEFAAFMWLPLIVYFSWPQSNLDGMSNKVWRLPQGVLPTSLCWAGLILTHNLTALMAAVMAVGAWFLLAAVALLRTSRVKSRSAVLGRNTLQILMPLLIGALLSAWYWSPALVEAGWVGIGAGAGGAGYANHFATWADLFTWALIYPYPVAAAPTVPLPSWVLIVLLLAVIGLARKSPASLRTALLLGLAAAVTSIWLTTASSTFVWQLLQPLLGKLQFPWRWQAILTPVLAISLAFAWANVAPGGGWTVARGRHAMVQMGVGIVLILYFAAYGTLGLAVSPAEGAAADITTAGMWAFDAQHGQVGASWTGEFLPNTVAEQRWAIGRAPSDGSSAASLAPVALAAVPERIGYLDATYQVTLSQPGTLILHRFDYPAWQVTIDGVGAPSRAIGALGQLGVDLPAGAHRVTIAWGAMPAVWFGRLLALVGWGVVLWGLLATRRRKWAVVIWLVAGALFVLGASGVLAKHSRPTLVGADFGPVRLEAVRAEPGVYVGETAAVDLTWSISGPVEPLTVFVHVLGPDGAVVAQQDAPLGGEYTPVERWLPGLVLETAQRVPIPADLPAGKYALKVGVYRPGAADAPLAPVGAADPRVDAGVLEVQR